MTPRQQAEMDRLRRRVRILERQNRAFSKARLDRLIWLVNEIEAACDQPYARPLIRVSRSDAKLIRPIVEALVSPTAENR